MARLIVLLDDDLFFAGKLQATLSSDYELRVLDHGDLAAIREQRPECVIVNFGASPEARSQFIRDLKTTLPHLPVLAFAGHLEVERHHLARAAGADKVVANSALVARPAQLIDEVIARVTAGVAPAAAEPIEE